MAFIGYIIITGLLHLAGFFTNVTILLPIFQLIPWFMFISKRIGILVPLKKIMTTDITIMVLLYLFSWITGKLVLWKVIVSLLLRVAFYLIVRYHDNTYLILEKED